MTEKLFITGPSGSGKTTSIIQFLPTFHGKIGGFIVQRNQVGAQTIGFCMIPAREARSSCIEVGELPKTCFLAFEEQVLRFDADLFTENFMKMTADADLIILDEIGGIELQLPEVRNRILSLLKNNIPLLAVWKSKEILLRMIQTGNAPDELLLLHQEMEALIRNQPGAAIRALKSEQYLPELASFFELIQKRKEHI